MRVHMHDLVAVWMMAVLAMDRLSRRAGDALGLAGLGMFAGAFALLALKRAFHPAAGAAFGLAGVFALLAVWAYRRAGAVRGFVTVLALGVIVFPGVFFLRPGVARLLSGSREHSRPVVTPAAPHDVVFVIFDQFPVSSLIDPETGGIERRAYPAFAAFADEATWFRNATAVTPATAWSVPMIVTGRWPDARKLPVAADHPDSLFTLLEPTHRCTSSNQSPSSVRRACARRFWHRFPSDCATCSGISGSCTNASCCRTI